jgi:hypothetical protein
MFPEKRLELLISPWAKTFYELAGIAQNDLLITSPFISSEPLNKLAGIISNKPLLQLHIIVWFQDIVNYFISEKFQDMVNCFAVSTF